MTVTGTGSTGARAEPRLLASALASSDGARLSEHLRFHGALPGAGRRDRAGAVLLDALGRAGLTGRGGAGFPTAVKAATVLQASRGALARRPVLVANVMEGEPASHKDRVLATSVPHLVLDGAQALAQAIGASAVYVCVADEHAQAAWSLHDAVAERAAAGIDPVPATVDRAPSGYVAGEESSLASWLNRGKGLPSFRPDRPSIVRVDGRPALVDNAETLANVALIARYGADWFRTAGTADAPGTALVTVSGPVARSGVWEIEYGTPLSAVLADAGAVPNPVGVLLGGYGGTWLSPASLDVPLAAPALAAIGATFGSGVVVPLAPSSCGLAETARITGWMAAESAGQCGPCAFGLPAVAGDLADLVAGRRARAALDRLQYRLREVDGRGGCRHPDFVVRLVRSALRTFAADVERHVHRGPCPGSSYPSVFPLPFH